MSSLFVQLKSIRLESVREFEDVTIPFGPGPNVVLMRNGYGKTTMLTLLRMMFTGAVPDASTAKGFQYKRAYGGTKERSTVTLELFIGPEAEKAEHHRLVLTMDHGTGQASYSTTSVSNRGHSETWALPLNFKSKFYNRPKFTDLFIFDAERAKELARTQDITQVDLALREITGLRSVFAMCEAGGPTPPVLDALLKKRMKESKITSIDSSANRWISWLEAVEAHIATQNVELGRVKKNLGIFEGQVRDKEAELAQAGDNDAVMKAHKAAMTDEKNASNTINQMTMDLLNELGNPSHLPGCWEATKAFHSTLFEAQIPEGVGAPFFEDILKGDECICGTEWTDGMRTFVRTHMDERLADDISGMLRRSQQRIRETVRDASVLVSMAENLTKEKVKAKRLAKVTKEIEARFDKAGQERAAALRDEIKQLKRQISGLKEQIDKMESTDADRIRRNGWDNGCLSDTDATKLRPDTWRDVINLYTLKRIERNLEQKMAGVGPLYMLSVAVDVASKTLDEACTRVMHRLRNQAESKANSTLAQIPSSGGGINLSLSSSGIQFVNDGGAVQEEANMATQVSAAYAFISAMSELGDVTSPLVADSPTTGLDPFSTEGWVDVIWPMFQQAIYIIESSERDKIAISAGRDAELYSSDVQRVLIRRENEGVSGDPQTGPMVLFEDDGEFKAYKPKGRARGDA